MTTVRDLLGTKQPGVWTITPGATVYQALELMAEKNFGALPVTEEDRLIGIFSERDYARKGILKGRASKETRVEELMSAPVIYVRPEQSLEECLAIMTQRQVRHLPVLEEGKLVGLVSLGDVGKAIISQQQVALMDLETYITGRRR